MTKFQTPTVSYLKGPKDLFGKVLPRKNLKNSFKQFANLQGRNDMQKKRMQNKRMQIKPTLNVKITLNISG